MHEEAVIEISMYDGLRAYLLAMGIIPYLIFDRSKPLLILVTIAPGLISVLFLDEIMALAGLGHTQHELGSIDYQLMSIRSLISYFLISSGCLVLQYIIYKDDQFNRQLIKDLRVKNAALIESQKKLNSINQNLEDIVDQKTEKLKKKNQALIKYAHTNAHHVRGPIARILGLIQVYTLDGNTDLKWFFEKIKIETEEVDIIVKNISKELNDLEHDKELKS